MTSSTCRAGHPQDRASTYIGPDGRGGCRPCRALCSRAYRRRRYAGPAHLDPTPLVRLQGDRTDEVFAEVLGVSRRTVIRWRNGSYANGVPRHLADRYATALGHTTTELWASPARSTT